MALDIPDAINPNPMDTVASIVPIILSRYPWCSHEHVSFSTSEISASFKHAARFVFAWIIHHRSMCSHCFRCQRAQMAHTYMASSNCSHHRSHDNHRQYGAPHTEMAYS